MKRCPTCQHAYEDNTLNFCLNDGSTLLRVESSVYDPSATAILPDARVTGQPQYPQPLVFNQAGSAGFKPNNRVIGIIGSSLIIIGIFLPIVSVLHLVSISYFGMISVAPGQAVTGIGVLLLGIVGLIFALTNRYRLLL